MQAEIRSFLKTDKFSLSNSHLSKQFLGGEHVLTESFRSSWSLYRGDSIVGKEQYRIWGVVSTFVQRQHRNTLNPVFTHFAGGMMQKLHTYAIRLYCTWCFRGVKPCPLCLTWLSWCPLGLTLTYETITPDLLYLIWAREWVPGWARDGMYCI